METLTNKRAIVITGGPGMGKTSIIESLEWSGYACVPESGRDIIQRQLKSKGDKLPWADRMGFAQEMFKRAVADYKQTVDQQTYTFFDRGIVDSIGYLSLCNLPISDEIRLAAAHYRYYDKVFITPPWPEIYVNDRERKQSFEEAEITYKTMKKVYTDFGYSLIEVPMLPIQDRAMFILQCLKINDMPKPSDVSRAVLNIQGSPSQRGNPHDA